MPINASPEAIARSTTTPQQNAANMLRASGNTTPRPQVTDQVLTGTTTPTVTPTAKVADTLKNLGWSLTEGGTYKPAEQSFNPQDFVKSFQEQYQQKNPFQNPFEQQMQDLEKQKPIKDLGAQQESIGLDPAQRAAMSRRLDIMSEEQQNAFKQQQNALEGQKATAQQEYQDTLADKSLDALQNKVQEKLGENITGGEARFIMGTNGMTSVKSFLDNIKDMTPTGEQIMSEDKMMKYINNISNAGFSQKDMQNPNMFKEKLLSEYIKDTGTTWMDVDAKAAEYAKKMGIWSGKQGEDMPNSLKQAISTAKEVQRVDREETTRRNQETRDRILAETEAARTAAEQQRQQQEAQEQQRIREQQRQNAENAKIEDARKRIEEEKRLEEQKTETAAAGRAREESDKAKERLSTPNFTKLGETASHIATPASSLESIRQSFSQAPRYPGIRYY